jgi:hypothetical protein
MFVTTSISAWFIGASGNHNVILFRPRESASSESAAGMVRYQRTSWTRITRLKILKVILLWSAVFISNIYDKFKALTRKIFPS